MVIKGFARGLQFDFLEFNGPQKVAEYEQRIIIPIVYRNNYLAALKALSQGANPSPIVRVFDFAKIYTASIRWDDFDVAKSDSQATNAFRDSTEAEDNGVRLVLPKYA